MWMPKRSMTTMTLPLPTATLVVTYRQERNKPDRRNFIFCPRDLARNPILFIPMAAIQEDTSAPPCDSAPAPTSASGVDRLEPHDGDGLSAAPKPQLAMFALAAAAVPAAESTLAALCLNLTMRSIWIAHHLFSNRHVILAFHDQPTDRAKNMDPQLDKMQTTSHL
jgi:hypothetical protein